MSAPQTRRSPRVGAGFEVDLQIALASQLYGDPERAARTGYHGHRPPHLTLVPRDESTIARELATAAARLRGIAFGAQVAGASLDAIDECGRIAAGCTRLIAQLRSAVRA